MVLVSVHSNGPVTLRGVYPLCAYHSMLAEVSGQLCEVSSPVPSLHMLDKLHSGVKISWLPISY